MPSAITAAVDVLHAGGLVAFPTETVYGLGADATNPAAVARLFRVKRRPRTHPVIVHIARPSDLDTLALDVSTDARRLARACWPGPLTVVLRRSRGAICDAVTGGADTVGVRVPDHPVAQELLASFGRPIAAPSANRFGRVSPTTAAHVRADLGDDVAVVLDGGAAAVGIESTIVDCTSAEVRVLRPGGVAREELEAVLGSSVADAADDSTGPSAPGRLASHYAPDVRVVVADGADASARACRLALDAGQRCGILALADAAPDETPAGVMMLAAPADTDEYARVLYARLREADAAGLDVLVVRLPPPGGRSVAIRDRLERASGR